MASSRNRTVPVPTDATCPFRVSEPDSNGHTELTITIPQEALRRLRLAGAEAFYAVVDGVLQLMRETGTMAIPIMRDADKHFGRLSSEVEA